MKRLLQSDLTKTLLYFFLTLTATAILAPWAFNAGKMIAEVAESRPTGDTARGLAGWCSKAEFSHFFLLSFLACASLFAGPFISWLRLGASSAATPGPDRSEGCA